MGTMTDSQAPADATRTARGSGIATFMGLPHTTNLDGVDAAIIGVPSDTGGTSGSSRGPRAIRDASALLRPANASQGIAPFETIRAIDYGDLTVIPGSLERTYQEIEAGLKPVFDAGVVPLLMGGDHSITLAHLRAAARAYGPVALLLFDSHTDTYDVYYGSERYNHVLSVVEGSRTMFRRAAEEGIVETAHSIMVGLRGAVYSPRDYDDARDLGYLVRTMDDVVRRGIPQTVADIRERLTGRPVFLSWDVDSLDPAFAPATGTLEAGGFSTREMLEIVRALDGIYFIGFDVVEVNPAFEGIRITATAGAMMLFEFLTLLAFRIASGATRSP
jgi:agmatinase